MRRFTCLLIILLSCMSLSLGAKAKPEKLLKAHLAQWEQFRWQGMVQVKHDALTLRKFFVIAKNSEALRLDILDSGVLGLNAKPMVALYIKDRIELEAPTIKQLDGLDLNWFVSSDQVKLGLQFHQTLLKHADTIIKDRKLSLDGQNFTFDKKMRLTGISSPVMKLEATLTYTKKNKPDKIVLKYKGKEAAIFSIDEITTTGIEITPLYPSGQPETEDNPDATETDE